MSKSIFLGILIVAFGLLAGCAQKPIGAGAQAYAAGGVGADETCYNCGTVTAINIVESKPQSSGAGVVIGALIGAAAGMEVSNNEDDDQGAAAGAVAGAAAGHEIERRSGQWYQIVVDMDRGGREAIYQRNAPAYGVGSRVRVTNT